MALHEQSVGSTDEWYTPKYVFEAMNVTFDMDVASPGKEIVPWIPACQHLTKNDRAPTWLDFIWMNPPFGPRNGIASWLQAFFEHGNGVCLTPDRTSAPWWQQYAPNAARILFVAPKIKFIGVDGNEGKSPAQGTTLMSIGKHGNQALMNAAKNGLGQLCTPYREGSHDYRV